MRRPPASSSSTSAKKVPRRVDAVHGDSHAGGHAAVHQRQRDRQPAPRPQHVGQQAVGRVVVVLAIAAEADDVEHHVVQVRKQRLVRRRANAASHRLGKIRDHRFARGQVRLGLIVLGDGPRGAEQPGRRAPHPAGLPRTRGRRRAGSKRAEQLPSKRSCRCVEMQGGSA